MIEAFGNKVIVTDLQHGEQVTDGGIVLPDDEGKLTGIHARWAKVHSVGEDVRDIKEGQWLLLEHGRWSYNFTDGEDRDTLYWLVDYPDGVLAIADELPRSYAVGEGA